MTKTCRESVDVLLPPEVGHGWDEDPTTAEALLRDRRYVGDGEQHYKPLPDAQAHPEQYVAPRRLRDAVNIAIELRRPLLVEGEPGTGKTRLAYAVAHELGYPLKEIYIRSTSEARDLLYTFDAVRRLYDIQEHSAQVQMRTLRHRRRRPTAGIRGIEQYVKLGKLGEAIALSLRNIPSVVLIDEIDKADIDFPNDLLLALDRLQFDIDEVPGTRIDALCEADRAIRRHFLPIVIITSNREKELPAPFLRRCIYYFIPFPKKAEELKPILEKHFKQEVTGLHAAALEKFWDLRQRGWRKPPSTSELLDWIYVLRAAEARGELTENDVRTASLDDLPFRETLLKTQSDWEAIETRSQRGLA